MGVIDFSVFGPPPGTLRVPTSPFQGEVSLSAYSSTSVGKNPASVLPAPVGAINNAERSSRAFSSKAN